MGADAYTLLASLYQTAKEAVGVASRAGLPVQFIDAEGAAILVWGSILSEARKRDMLPALQSAIQRDYPSPEIAHAFSELKMSVSSSRAPAFAPRASIRSGDFEKVTGSQPTFLPISFLALGIARARSVARIACGDGSFGSGFLIDKNLVLTNHHVLSSPEDARMSTVEFGYETTDRGTMRPAVAFQCAPDLGFKTCDQDDWTLVRLSGDANQDWGSIPIDPVGIKPDEFVNIIQHPGGGPKQIALYHNVVVFADNSRVQYLTDTMPGSSGSPVFDSRWQVVALHHAGGWLKQGGRDALFCNEGIAVEVVLDGISKADL